MKHHKSLFLAAAVGVVVSMLSGCVKPDTAKSTVLVVGKLDLATDRAKYVAQAKNGSVIRVSVARELYVEKVHGLIRLDGELPTYALTVFQVSIDGVNMDIPCSAYSTLGDPHIGREFYPLKIEYLDSGIYHVYLSGSDGAGSYEVRFVFSQQGWIRKEWVDTDT